MNEIKKLNKEINWTYCNCGMVLYSKTNEFICGMCGCHIFKKEVKNNGKY